VISEPKKGAQKPCVVVIDQEKLGDD